MHSVHKISLFNQPMKKVTSILFIGPSTSLNPITTEEYPTFLLPVLNRSFLEMNLSWLARCSDRIVIVVVKSYEEMVKNSVQKYRRYEAEKSQLKAEISLNSDSLETTKSTVSKQSSEEIRTENNTDLSDRNNDSQQSISRSVSDMSQSIEIISQQNTEYQLFELKENNESAYQNFNKPLNFTVEMSENIISHYQNSISENLNPTSENVVNHYQNSTAKNLNNENSSSLNLNNEAIYQPIEINDNKPFYGINDVLIDFHVIEEYSGTFNEVSNIDTEGEILLITKSDMVTEINPNKLIAEFYKCNSPLMTVLIESDSKYIVGHTGRRLVYYGNDIHQCKYGMFSNFGQIEFNCLLDTGQIYVANKSIFSRKLGPSFSKNALPFLIDHFRQKTPVSIYNPGNYIYRATSIEQYIHINSYLKTYYSFPNNVFEMSENRVARKVSFKENDMRKSIVGYSQLLNTVSLYNSIVGNNVDIGGDCRLVSCIVMDGARIGKNCILEECIIGIDVVINDGSRMKKCVIGCGYRFESSAYFENQKFMKLEF